MEKVHSFSNDFARNAVIFDVDNSLSSHTDNQKNNFLVLGEVPTGGITDSIGASKKKKKKKIEKITFYS